MQTSLSELVSEAARAMKWLFCKSCGLLSNRLRNVDVQACLEHFLCKAFPNENV